MEYDNTNTGAVFPPREDQKMILQGRMNINGNEQSVCLVKATTKNGKKLVEVYGKIGVLFEDEEKKKENAPDYSGPMEGSLENMRIAGWRKMKDTMPYMSLVISEKKSNNSEAKADVDTATADIDDDFPF